MKNIELSRALLADLGRRGVRELVLCAGARNASFVTVLSVASGVTTYAFFEERSAGFFALGRIAEAGRPVAVVTTSGTAAAELLPAVIEADYRGLPLIVVTADRPRRYRGSGAPQTIVQPGLFSNYVEACVDVEGAWTTEGVAAWSRRRPLHLNVCFDEPLLDAANEPWAWPAPDDAVPSAAPRGVSPEPIGFAGTAPLIVVGGLSRAEAERVRPVLAGWNRPLYLEASSQLRGDPALARLELIGGDPRAVPFDSVIRVGQVPTLRLWRDLERSGLDVVHFSSVPLSGLPGGGTVHTLAAASGLRAFRPADLTEDRRRGHALDRLLAEHPRSEPAWVRRVSRAVPPGAHLFIGNSLPIREWDLAAIRGASPHVFANRGANGIDGLISTFAGVCAVDRANWCVLGDLSTLYDLSGPWAWRARPVADVNVVVVNNGGGRIFERLFRNPSFENRHDLGFADWARMWGLAHEERREPVDLAGGGRPRVIEIIPDEGETAAFWRAWEAV